jgi:hypothetical protein
MIMMFLHFAIAETCSFQDCPMWNQCSFILSSCLQVVEHGLFVKHCKVEVYLLELKLCENSDPTNVLSCHFSKADTIGEQLG